MKKEHSAGVIVYAFQEQEPVYLLLQHAWPDNHWDFPKGRIEEEESLQDAAVRELFEETGLRCELNTRFCYNFEYFIERSNEPIQKQVTLFMGLANNTTILLSHEHQNFIWLPFEQAMEKISYDNARSALKEIQRYLHVMK